MSASSAPADHSHRYRRGAAISTFLITKRSNAARDIHRLLELIHRKGRRADCAGVQAVPHGGGTGSAIYLKSLLGYAFGAQRLSQRPWRAPCSPSRRRVLVPAARQVLHRRKNVD